MSEENKITVQDFITQVNVVNQVPYNTVNVNLNYSPNNYVSISHQTFPSPHIVKEYADIDPSIAQKIVDMAVNQQAHRHKLENKKLTAKRVESTLDRVIPLTGQFFAFLITIFAMKYGVNLIMHGEKINGTIFAGVGLAPIIGTFIWNYKKKKDN